MNRIAPCIAIFATASALVGCTLAPQHDATKSRDDDARAREQVHAALRTLVIEIAESFVAGKDELDRLISYFLNNPCESDERQSNFSKAALMTPAYQAYEWFLEADPTDAPFYLDPSEVDNWSPDDSRSDSGPPTDQFTNDLQEGLFSRDAEDASFCLPGSPQHTRICRHLGEALDLQQGPLQAVGSKWYPLSEGESLRTALDSVLNEGMQAVQDDTPRSQTISVDDLKRRTLREITEVLEEQVPNPYELWAVKFAYMIAVALKNMNCGGGGGGGPRGGEPVPTPEETGDEDNVIQLFRGQCDRRAA